VPRSEQQQQSDVIQRRRHQHCDSNTWFRCQRQLELCLDIILRQKRAQRRMLHLLRKCRAYASLLLKTTRSAGKSYLAMPQ
jgi:hypothetical protein